MQITTASGPVPSSNPAEAKKRRLAEFRRFPQILDGRYELKHVLGLGGMGGICLALDKQDDSDVVVKITDKASRKVSKRRITEEVNAIKSINHRNIVSLKDAGTFLYTDAITREAREMAYEVMELMAGEDLGRYIDKKGAIPWATARDFASQACEGLGALHENGIIHRDVKPDNIFVTVDGVVKVIDFGLCWFTSSFEANENIPGKIVGTPQYIPPERIRGEAETFLSDVYSMGVVLYEMLCGRPPFNEENQDNSSDFKKLSIQIERHDPPLPSAYAPYMGIPKRAERIVMRAMQKDPAERFQSMREMRDAILDVFCASGLMFSVPKVSGSASRLINQMNTLETTVQDTIPVSSASVPTQEIV